MIFIRTIHIRKAFFFGQWVATNSKFAICTSQKWATINTCFLWGTYLPIKGAFLIFFAPCCTGISITFLSFYAHKWSFMTRLFKEKHNIFIQASFTPSDKIYSLSISCYSTNFWIRLTNKNDIGTFFFIFDSHFFSTNCCHFLSWTNFQPKINTCPINTGFIFSTFNPKAFILASSILTN